MQSWLVGPVVGIALVLGAICLVLLLRDVAPQDRTFAGIGVLEVLLIVQLVVGSIALAHTDDDANGTLFVSYLVGNVLVLPIGVFWSLAERTRSGTGVLVVALVTVLALEVRLLSIWGGAGA